MFTNVKNIAVINLGYIGDVAISSCVTLALKNKFPNSKITYITVPRSKNIAPQVAGVDDVVIFDKDNEQKGLNIIKWVADYRAKNKTDMAILLNETFRSGILANMIGAKYRLGHASEGRGFLLTHTVEWLQEERDLQLNISKIYMRNLEPLNITFDEFDMGLTYAEDDKKAVMSKVYQLGGKDKILVGFCPCAGFDCKDWNLEQSKEFIDFVNKNYSNRKIVILGTEMATKFAEGLRHIGCTNFIDMTCNTTIPELIALTSNCEMFVSVDSSPMHISIAQKIPTIGIFRQNNIKKWWPDFYQRGIGILNTETSPTSQQVCEAYAKLYKQIYG